MPLRFTSCDVGFTGVWRFGGLIDQRGGWLGARLPRWAGILRRSVWARGFFERKSGSSRSCG